MANFRIIRKGYSQVEVDDYIAKLVNDYETKLSEQKDRIFYLKDQLEKITNSSDGELVTSLVSAVERAKLIENSSKNIYELETKKLSLLYSKMENLLSNVDGSVGLQIKEELLNLIKDCRKSLQNNILMQNENLKDTTIGDPIKKLLSKMIDFNKISNGNNTASFESKPEAVLTRNIDKFVESKPEIKMEKQQKITVIKKQESKEQENNFSEFLSKDDELNGGNFASIMFTNTKKHENSNYITKKDIGDYTPNETGFDLKEAVNPTEDLEDIMKAFDFYNDDKKKK